ncbi:MAG: deoxyribonuclease IV [Candidatus Nanoarchaeia archaeon]|jgi:deoxyribonuclease-4
MLFGAHESIANKIYRSLDIAKEDGCDCVQVFTKSPRMWNSPPISDKDAFEFKRKAAEFKITPNVSHASFLLNIANEDDKKRKFAVKNLIDEVKRAQQLGLMGLMFHPGSNADKKKGIQYIIEGINEVIEKTPESKIIIMVENTAGTGNWLGSTFPELKEILAGIKDKSRFGFCLDTCHLFAAGYDLKDDYKNVFEEFDKLIGLKYLRCFHLNDSLFALGSKKDRHEHPGKGFIGKKGFEQLVNDARFKSTPGYLEAPGTDYKGDIKYLRKLIK